MPPRSCFHCRKLFPAYALISLILAILVHFPFELSQANEDRIGTIKVIKAVPKITFEGRIFVVLTIENNGTLPIFELEIYEYLNPTLRAAGVLTITQASNKSQLPMDVGGVGTTVQIIVNPPEPNRLGPGGRITLEYSVTSPGSGDYQIPTSLVWYSYNLKGTTIRTSIYSNGLMIHVPNDFEKAVTRVYPYALSLTTFTITLRVLFWARRKLSRPVFP